MCYYSLQCSLDWFKMAVVQNGSTIDPGTVASTSSLTISCRRILLALRRLRLIGHLLEEIPVEATPEHFVVVEVSVGHQSPWVEMRSYLAVRASTLRRTSPMQRWHEAWSHHRHMAKRANLHK
eukprot:GHVR01030723.1.p1 GENE.GHVR01030723.1~~GHVR01030723.1.p1  ORF type:complete len:123 (+),score=6.09 GHVR01030723.1:4-372(+)